MNISFCPNCKERAHLNSVKTKEIVDVRGEAIEVEVEYLKCSNCNEELSSFEGKDEMVEAYKKYRSIHNLLRPEEIRAFRKSYDLTQGELAKLLGVSIATLSRYENGALQDKVHDNLLKMAMEPKGFIRLLNENRTVLSDEKREQLLERACGSLNDRNDPEKFAARFIHREASEFTGFRQFSLERFEEAVLYLAQGGVAKTKLNKLLYYADMKCYKENAAPITGAKYIHLNHGPVPDNYELLLGVMVEKGILTTEEREYGELTYDLYFPGRDPNLSLFTSAERKTLELVLSYFQSFTAKRIRDYSHEEQAYKATTDKEPISFVEHAPTLSI